MKHEMNKKRQVQTRADKEHPEANKKQLQRRTNQSELGRIRVDSNQKLALIDKKHKKTENVCSERDNDLRQFCNLQGHFCVSSFFQSQVQSTYGVHCFSNT